MEQHMEGGLVSGGDEPPKNPVHIALKINTQNSWLAGKLLQTSCTCPRRRRRFGQSTRRAGGFVWVSRARRPCRPRREKPIARPKGARRPKGKEMGLRSCKPEVNPSAWLPAGSGFSSVHRKNCPRALFEDNLSRWSAVGKNKKNGRRCPSPESFGDDVNIIACTTAPAQM